MKIIFIKRQVLALAGDGEAVLYRRPNDWSAVRAQLTSYLSTEPVSEVDSAQKADLSIVSYLLMNVQKPKLDYIEVEGFCAYHRASVVLPTREFLTTRLGALAQSYPKHVHDRYRFAIVHQDTGQTRVEILRRTTLD